MCSNRPRLPCASTIPMRAARSATNCQCNRTGAAFAAPVPSRPDISVELPDGAWSELQPGSAVVEDVDDLEASCSCELVEARVVDVVGLERLAVDLAIDGVDRRRGENPRAGVLDIGELDADPVLVMGARCCVVDPSGRMAFDEQ